MFGSRCEHLRLMFCLSVWTFAMSGWHRRIVVPLGSPPLFISPTGDNSMKWKMCLLCRRGYVGKCLKTFQIWIKHWNLFRNMPGREYNRSQLLVPFQDLRRHQTSEECWAMGDHYLGQTLKPVRGIKLNLTKMSNSTRVWSWETITRVSSGKLFLVDQHGKSGTGPLLMHPPSKKLLFFIFIKEYFPLKTCIRMSIASPS